jgi:hypothetical protein
MSTAIAFSNLTVFRSTVVAPRVRSAFIYRGLEHMPQQACATNAPKAAPSILQVFTYRGLPVVTTGTNVQRLGRSWTVSDQNRSQVYRGLPVEIAK